MKIGFLNSKLVFSDPCRWVGEKKELIRFGIS
jgi:hypothetical protein